MASLVIVVQLKHFLKFVRNINKLRTAVCPIDNWIELNLNVNVMAEAQFSKLILRI